MYYKLNYFEGILIVKRNVAHLISLTEEQFLNVRSYTEFHQHLKFGSDVII